MNRKILKALAQELNRSKPIYDALTFTPAIHWQWEKDCAAVAIVASKLNPRFDAIKFGKACETGKLIF